MLFDSHAHYDDARFDPDRDALLSSMRQRGVSRILCVADAYDAMTSDRPYRKGLPREEAVRRLLENAGTQFDPEVVQAFVAAERAKQ